MVFSIWQSLTANHYSGVVILVFCAATWIGIQHLGYVEFDQARRMILRKGFREALNAELLRRCRAAFPTVVISNLHGPAESPVYALRSTSK